MNPRTRGKAEIAYNKACHELERVFSDAAKAGVDTDDLIFCAYGIATRKTGLQHPAMATKESAFELRLKPAPQNAGPLAQDAPPAGHTPFQESSEKNQGHSNGPAKEPNSSLKENHPCLEACRMTAAAAILSALFGTSGQATEGCAAARLLLEGAHLAGVPFCSQGYTRRPRFAAMRQEPCRGCPQTDLSFPKYRRFLLSCPALQSILDMTLNKGQGIGIGGAA